MPLEAPLAPASERAAELNARYRNHAAVDVLRHALTDPQVGSTALVSSFGAESVVLLHLLSTLDRSVPVIFLDTEMLFPETKTYQKDLAESLGLNVRVIGPDRAKLLDQDPEALLYRRDPDACCAMRKTEPLEHALSGFDAWITGRKRVQGGARATLEFFEADEQNRIKINPLAHFTLQDIQDYITNNRLPRHPLVARGFASIGCAPCTTKTKPGEDPRAGRWRGQDKTECGIHIVDGKIVRKRDAA
ncbi:phosphoadenylyl-sulfate reductase [Litoreibacter janthinus]|uniref:Adenosine 5'-phosphosulfate reductase n=1 Tax=Litoreibacter janthinus TaxID=670154 RepID=A0A1I6H058_9RHOB|nr:phosphoadenylyl-sulfate reductase [Litoreibacter janthinus]SFR47651.1 phosphoadenylylsulfate reductase (thioredoxin) [Litoreibacter janthinus]